MKLLVDAFITPLAEKNHGHPHLAVFFATIRQICHLNLRLVSELTMRGPSALLGELLMSHSAQLHLFERYANDYSNAVRILKR
jgi:hypothetical protein